MNIEIPMRKAKSEIRSLDFQEKNCTKFNPEKLSHKMALENWLNQQTRLVDSIKNPLAADVSLGKLKQIILKDRPHYHREKFIDWVFDNQICQFIGNKESLRIFDEIRNEADNQAKATQQQQAKPVGDAGAVDDAITEPVSAKIIQANSNEFEFSGLLHQPNGKDDWFEVIDVMTKNFYSKHKVIPTKAQAWTQLCTSPPFGYDIKPDVDAQSLTRPGVIKPFNIRSFGRRWVKYTAESNPFAPN
ncbi:MAG: hypothetical protein WC504_08340 [Methylobacter sp.]